MTGVAMRPGGVIVCLFGAFLGGWWGNLGGRDKRRASFRHVGGWFDAIIPYGSGAPLPYISSENRSEEHTSELQSLMRISYAVFCLKKKNKHNIQNTKQTNPPHTANITIYQQYPNKQSTINTATTT